MVPLTSLWLPIVLSAIAVFLASFVLHMLLPFHRADYRKLASEDEIMDALRRFNIPPGDYMMPRPPDPSAMRSPAFVEKFKKGPVAMITVMPGGSMSMRNNLIQWFIFCLIVGVISAYIAGRALAPGAPYLEVLRFAGCVAFVGYSLALWEMLIWYKRAWGTTIRSTIDGLIYGLLTGCTLAYFWPK